MGRIAVVALLCIGIGFFAGRRFAPSTTPSPASGPDLTNLQSIAETDLAEYYRLKTLEERYKKADEILGKIVGIFLADLGLRVSGDVERASKEPSPVALAAPTSDTATAKKETEAPTNDTAAASGGPFGSAATSATPGEPNPTRPSLDSLNSSQEIADFLKRVEIRDFDAALKASTGFANKTATLASLQGRFVGVASVLKRGTQETWDAELELNGQMARGIRFRGNYSLKFAKNGKVFSNKTGRGNLADEFREWKDDPEVIFIEASPDTFIQVYYLKGPDMIVGNVLEQPNRAGAYRTIGTIKLQRN